ncbi:hypothetical protein BDB01DRAFT_830492 [Pilobolus umbonatus]|nr:hypothetical protein BDB01DRAFT_830492 [Pilobolus umbonatus]
MKFCGVYKALYKYQAQNDEELTFQEDDVLYVINNDDPHWFKAQTKLSNLDNSEGLIPSNYIEKHHSKKVESKGKVKALYRYIKRADEELSFSVNDILRLYDTSDPDWFIAEDAQGEIGYVPRNHVEAYDEPPSSTTNTQSGTTGPLSPTDSKDKIHKKEASAVSEAKWAIALYKFTPENEEETSLDENEHIQVIDSTSISDWWVIRHKNGLSGLVPATYVQYAENKQSSSTTSNTQRIETGDSQLEKGIMNQVDKRNTEKYCLIKPITSTANGIKYNNIQTSQTVQAPSNPPQNKSIDSQQTNENELDKSKLREWTDRTGSFKVAAQFVCYVNGKIRLHKTNGVKIDVPLEKMCKDDIHYVEKELDQKIDDRSDDIPLAHLSGNSRFSWLEFFKKINIPHSACISYSSAFNNDGLQEKDIDRLTYKKMRSLGLTEKHIRRIQRFIETNQPEPPSDNESEKKRKVKKTVTFGPVTYIDIDYSSVNNNNKQANYDTNWQIAQDEKLARQLQEAENVRDEGKSGQPNMLLHRKATGRALPNHPYIQTASPVQIEQLMKSTAPLKPTPAPTSVQPPLNQNTINPDLFRKQAEVSGFDDDAWKPRSSPSLSSNQSHNNASPHSNHSNITDKKGLNTNDNNSINNLFIIKPPNLPPRNSDSAGTSLDSLKPDLLPKWTGSPALPNKRPVPPLPTNSAPGMPPVINNQLVAQGSFYNNQGNGTSYQMNPPMQSYQQTGLSPSLSNMTPIQSYQHTGLSPSVSNMTPIMSRNMISGHPSGVLQSSPVAGSNWAESTPDNPFGVRLRPVMSNPNASHLNQSFSAAPPTPANQYLQSTPTDPTDKYSVFKTISSDTSSVFRTGQQTAGQPAFLPQQNTGNPSFINQPNYNRW